MSDFDFELLPLFPAAAFAALVVRFRFTGGVFALEPGGEEGGGAEGALGVADYLG